MNPLGILIISKLKTMAKEIAGQIKLQIKGGAANPSPPVGPALGSKGINIVKTPPVAIQVMEAAKVKGGSAEPNRKKVGEITWEQVKAIAEDKLVDLNCFTVESAMKMVAGTARSMGITVKGEFPVNN